MPHNRRFTTEDKSVVLHRALVSVHTLIDVQDQRLPVDVHALDLDTALALVAALAKRLTGNPPQSS